MGNTEEIENAEAHLEQAKAALAAAEQDERAAQLAEKEALKDIDEALEEIEHAEHREIKFEVNGEEHKTNHPVQTPDHIITEYAKKDPATNYLIKIMGKDKISFQGQGGVDITIHECDKYQTVSTGPTPVS